MKYKEIFYPTTLDKVDRYDDNIDVIVTLENGENYVLVVATPKNMLTLMDKESSQYIEAGTPFAFVKELTHENIINLVDSFCKNDAYWLKLYHYSIGEIKFPPRQIDNIQPSKIRA